MYMEKDPVCGMDVDPKSATWKSEYQDKTYYFCSLDCKLCFDCDPANYVGNMSSDHTHHH